MEDEIQELVSSTESSSESPNFQNEDERKIVEEFYWLRFLEVDPASEHSRNSCRSTTSYKKMGRSMFTVTKRLRKTTKGSFGFEAGTVWTKPPLLQHIEPHTPAAHSHLEPGDFIIFIDKINIVDMERNEILELIDKSDALILEVFRRASVNKKPLNNPPILIPSTSSSLHASFSISKQNTTSSESTVENAVKSSQLSSESSFEAKRKQLVTFSKESIPSATTDNQRKNQQFLANLFQSEHQFMETLNFGHSRYVVPLKHRKDLLTPTEHEILFKNIEALRAEMENEIKNHREDDLQHTIESYKRRISSIIDVYKNYFTTLKHCNCIMVDKTHHSEFIKFIADPPIPSNQLVLNSFLHKPLEHFKDVIKTFQLILAHCHIDSKDFRDVTFIINEMKAAYEENYNSPTEQKSNVKPLLKDLESRMVFTKCKPFKLDIPDRQWIFGGDLTRVDGKNLLTTYTLLFSDILLFSKITRDRVLFITEEPIQLNTIIDSCFNVRKKNTEFRLTTEPNRNPLSDDTTSPTANCTPNLIRKSPMKLFKRRVICLRAQTEDIKNIWQNLLSRQIFLINSSNSEKFLDTSQLISHPFTMKLSSELSLAMRSNTSLELKHQNHVTASTNIDEKTDRSLHQTFSERPGISISTYTNLRSQKAFDMGDSLEEIHEESENSQLVTPETPSCANVSSIGNGNGNTTLKCSPSSMTFSSVAPSGGSWDNILDDFDKADVSFANDVRECLFLEDDPFLVKNS